jgi:hypothetical protein
VQEKLALSCQLTTTPAGASFIWRDRLGYTQDFATRLAIAHDFLRQGHVQLGDRTRQFCDSPEGMCLVVENHPDIHERGNRVPHQMPPTHKIYQGALTHCPDAGMRAIADFVCV